MLLSNPNLLLFDTLFKFIFARKRIILAGNLIKKLLIEPFNHPLQSFHGTSIRIPKNKIETPCVSRDPGNASLDKISNLSMNFVPITTALINKVTLT